MLATTPEWAALTHELGGDKVDVYAATSAFQDVHRVEAKPSLVARARNADLVVAAGRGSRDRMVAHTVARVRQCTHPARQSRLF